MFEKLKKSKRLQETLFMALLSFSCFGFSVFRYLYTDTDLFLTLNWNLFLAFIPWAISSLALKLNIRKKRYQLIAIGFLWLLFFPNSLYITTDLMHLQNQTTMPLWYDVILILSFAWTGLLFGFLSLWDMERIMKKAWKPKWVTLISMGLLFFGSFGVYLGRFLRLNSWNLFSEPFQLFYNVGKRIVNPFAHPRMLGMTLFMGLFLTMVYWSFRLVVSRVKN